MFTADKARAKTRRAYPVHTSAPERATKES
jgi:hypothetical protein